MNGSPARLTGKAMFSCAIVRLLDTVVIYFLSEHNAISNTADEISVLPYSITLFCLSCKIHHATQLHTDARLRGYISSFHSIFPILLWQTYMSIHVAG